MFEVLSVPDSRPITVLKRALLVVVVSLLIVEMVASYRAYYQVRSLKLNAPERGLHDGSIINTIVVSFARTPVDLRIELIQGSHAATLALQVIPDNTWPFFDPRLRQATQSVVLTPELLARFQPGSARLRATATGREQWTRLPPPLVREQSVEIQH